MTVREVVCRLAEKEIIIPTEMCEKELDLNAHVTDRLPSSICKIVEVWEPYLKEATPENKGKIAVRAISSFCRLNCCAINNVRDANTCIKRIVDVIPNTPDIVTAITEEGRAYLRSEEGRKSIL